MSTELFRNNEGGRPDGRTDGRRDGGTEGRTDGLGGSGLGETRTDKVGLGVDGEGRAREMWGRLQGLFRIEEQVMFGTRQ